MNTTSFQINRIFAALARNIICIVEDLKVSHENKLQKLKNSLPKEYHHLIDLANTFDDSAFSQVRKRVLDNINAQKRDAETLIK